MLSRWVEWSRSAVGAQVAHPVSIAAILVLLINDHFLKSSPVGHTDIVGKLSDFAGLVFFPLLIVSAIDVLAFVVGRSRAQPWVLTAAAATTAIAFAVTKINPGATGVWNEALGALQWIVSLGPLLGSRLVSTALVADPTDLIALPAVLLPLALLVRPQRRAARAQGRLTAVSLSVLIVSGAAVIATSEPVGPTAQTVLSETIHLSAGSPSASRRYLIDVTNRDPNVARIEIIAFATTAGSDAGPAASMLQNGSLKLALVADPADQQGFADDKRYSTPAFDLTSGCTTTCHREVTVHVQATDPESLSPDVAIDLTLNMKLLASAGSASGAPLDIDLGLVMATS